MFASLPHLDHPAGLLVAGAPPPRSPLAFPRVAATRELVRARTRELAIRAGRDPWDVTQSDYEQAKREVTGEAQPDRQDALLDGAPPPPVEAPVAAGAFSGPGETTRTMRLPSLP